MDALIFDFDGVVVDSEPIHLAGFQEVMARASITLTREEYYGKYLGCDDHDCLAIAARDKGVELSERQIAEMTAEKTKLVKRAFGESIRPLPGAVDLIRAAADANVPTAVCSGALKEEIRLAAGTIGVLENFVTIVSAEDVSRGKPDPEGYRMTLEQLASALGRDVAAGRTVVVEDAPAGIEAAHQAGMKVLAVTSSYGAESLTAADRTVDSLAGVTIQSLDELL
jgi:HAD superfamily hydrolase (TIGR01509 family)